MDTQFISQHDLTSSNTHWVHAAAIYRKKYFRAQKSGRSTGLGSKIARIRIRHIRNSKVPMPSCNIAEENWRKARGINSSGALASGNTIYNETQCVASRFWSASWARPVISRDLNRWPLFSCRWQNVALQGCRIHNKRIYSNNDQPNHVFKSLPVRHPIA